MVELLAPEFPDRHYTKLDLTPRMVEVANAKGVENARFIVGDAEDPPLDGGSFDAIKNTNATFKWGTDSGEEFVELEPRLQLVSEQSYNVEMRKHTLRGKLFAATFGKNVNNRLAVFAW